MRCLLVLVTALGLTAASEMPLTVENLLKFIRSSIQLKQPDTQVADALRHFKMVEKLDDRIVEELQGMGAGPKTVAVLREMSNASASLPAAPLPGPAPVVAPVPPPDPSEQAKILDETRQYVMNYTKNLPNFICVQVTRRDVDPSSSGNHWLHSDTITARLSYNGFENYEVILHNSQPVTNVKMEQLGGTVSAGEFGSMMKEIFEPASHTHFAWERWATLRGRRTYVFAYDIEREYSRFHVEAGERGSDSQSIIPAYRGLIYIDRDTTMVTKVTLNPYDMPPDFPVREAHETLDYDLQNIGGSEYMLPLKAVVTLQARYLTRNEIEFRLYRKFGTETTIKFDTPDALPEDQIKETAPQDKPQK